VQEGGAEAVKLEGGRKRVPVVRAVRDAEIPVMGHLGLTPQSVHQFGGYRIQGKSATAAEKLLDDARCLQEAGCYSLVLEGIPAQLAAEVTEALHIPTIGIGAGPHCDGQVLVLYDLLGLDDRFNPKFVKKYENLHDRVIGAVSNFAEEVRTSQFPTLAHSHGTEPTQNTA
jgi:3-methyl-2-oxobutanoate hydroxymethyltransferase